MTTSGCVRAGSTANRAVQQVRGDGHPRREQGDPQAPEHREPRLGRQDQNPGERDQCAESDAAAGVSATGVGAT